MAARTPIPGGRQTGTILDWKGSFGWIKPSRPINHPKAKQRQGKIYLGAEDVKEELEGIGATVSFTLYSDNSGLGAADVKPASSTPPAKAKPAMNGAAKPATSNAVAQFRAANGGHKNGGKAAGKGGKAGGKGNKGVQQTAFDKKAGAQQGGKGNGKSAKGKGKKGGKSPREVLHDEPLLGEIIEWKGKYGWITPHDTIDHPLAGKHRGDLIVFQEDVEEEIEGVGTTVQFMLFGDARSLGAQNVRPA